MLIAIWRSLTEGAPIDEQRTLRRTANQTIPDVPVVGTSSRAADDDSDNDRDPNDTAAPVQYISTGDPYADLEDDYADDW